jgi:hypothetical protein
VFELNQPATRDYEIVTIVLYKIVHGFNFKHMSNRYDVGAPNVRKYVNLDKEKLFGKYINMFFNEQPLGVIDQYQEFTGLPNIFCAIDGIHISLIEKLSKIYTLPMLEYYN